MPAPPHRKGDAAHSPPPTALAAFVTWRRAARLLALVAGLAAGAPVSQLHAQTAEATAPILCSPSASSPPDWTRATSPAHALIGRVWSAGSAALTSWGNFETALATTLTAGHDAILLGEVHDNPAHHALRAHMLHRMACAGTTLRTAVFEHIRADQTPALDAFYAQAAGQPGRPNADGLMRSLDWQRSGWPRAAIFAPLFQAALDLNLHIAAGEPARGRVRSIARHGQSELPPPEQLRLGLDRALPAPLAAALLEELKSSHCGMLPARALPAMAAAQRYRDAHLADIVITATTGGRKAVLLAGNGHMRTDRAVPWAIRQRQAALRVLTIMLVETSPAERDPASYIPRGPDRAPAADFIVFTPRTERPDPCAAMRPRKPDRS